MNMPEGNNYLPGSPYYNYPEKDMCIFDCYESPCEECGDVMCPKTKEIMNMSLPRDCKDKYECTSYMVFSQCLKCKKE